MSSLRTIIVGLLLAGVAYGTYVSLTKNPKSTPSNDAPVWTPGSSDTATVGTAPAASRPGAVLSADLPGFGSNLNSGGAASPPNASVARSPVAEPSKPLSEPSVTGLAFASSNDKSPIGPNSPALSPAVTATTTPTGTLTAPPLSNAPPAASSATPPVAAITAPVAGLPTISPPAQVPPSSNGSRPVVVYPAQMPSQIGYPGGPVPNTSAAAVSAAPPATAAVSPAAATPPVRDEFQSLLQVVEAKLNQGDLGEAHLALSKFYGNPRLSSEESRRLTEMLDQVAGTVIYSRQHLIESPYKVQPGDTLEQIGRLYNVPGELLAKINGIRDPSQLPPGAELKVVRGPFDAIIDLNRYEMTLMVQGRYAGRFPIGIGASQKQLEGQFLVRDKRIAPAAGADPAAPPLKYVDLGNQVSIHAADGPQSLGRTAGQGCIGMSPRDIDDVYDILAIGSRVTIRR